MISTDRKHGDGPSYPIPVWNGIFDHRRKIGPAIWVFLWCLDRITREESGVGIVLGGSVVTAERIASELQESVRTIRRHFRRLTTYGYVGLKRTPYGFIITVANSRKIDIWRADKNGHPERTKMPVRSDKRAGQTDKTVRSNKEDSAVDSAQRQTPPLPLPKIGRGDIWQEVLQKLKEDFASAYVSNKHFQEEKFDKHFRDSWLVKIEDGVAFLDAPDPQALADGLRQFHPRVSKTFLAVAGFEVKFQLLARARQQLEASA